MGVVMQFETDLAQAIFTERSEKQAVLAETGLFAKPIPVPDTVDIQTKVLALHGRSLNWRAA
jgi:acyl-CoA hydrolase